MPQTQQPIQQCTASWNFDFGQFADQIEENRFDMGAMLGTLSATEAIGTMPDVHNPPHPGLTLRDDVLPALGLSVGEAAAQLGVDRTTLSKVLNGRAAISPSMALRIEHWLGRERGGAAEMWLAQQTAFDLWRARAALKKTKVLARIRSASHQAA